MVKEYERFGSSQLIAPPSADIQRLPDSCFSVWLAAAGPPQPPSQSEPGPLEEKILKLWVSHNFREIKFVDHQKISDLTVAPGTLRKTLTILRKSDLVLRLVTTDTDENNKDFMWGQSQSLQP